MEEVEINNADEMLAYVIATLFTPKEISEDSITYDKETIYKLACGLEDVFKMWYDVDLSEELKDLK